MKNIKKLYSLFFMFFIFSYNSLGQNPIIANLVNEVSGDSIFNHISYLQEFERNSITEDNEARDFICNYLKKNEFDTIFYQYYNDGWLPNIVAVKYGNTNLDSIYVLGAHYDSYSISPGADDNASGTSSVLEISKVLSKIVFKNTIMFVLFSGEENGLVGSNAFVDSMIMKSNNIKGMVNLDMISYSRDSNNIFVTICVNSFSKNIMNTYIKSISKYTPNLPFRIDSTSMLINNSDHKPFWNKNIAAIFLTKETDFNSNNFNPYYHKETDILGMSSNSKVQTELISKSVLATITELLEFSTLKTYNLEKSKYNINFFPNPFSQTAKLEFENKNNETYQLQITDITGKLLQSQQSKSNVMIIEKGNMPSGMYFYKLQNSLTKESYNGKFVVE